MFFKKREKISYDKARLPQHIGIIMDGNGRWAAKRGLPRSAGHNAGVNTMRRIIQHCGDIGIKSLTLYAFSTENVNREAAEVSALMVMVKKYLNNIEKELGGKDARLKIIGETEYYDDELRQAIANAEDFTKDKSQLNLNIALFYGGQAEIVTAAKRLVADGKVITIDGITEQLYTAGQPPLDLIIRSGGEQRLSNFLLWQSSYAELYFCDTLWPDFKEADLLKALRDYQGRKRRFGKA